MMRKKLVSILVVAVFFVLAAAFGARAGDNDWSAAGSQIRVDRDFGALHMNDTNRFGDDRASSSTFGGTDRDADFRLFHWVPNTYGIMGDYGYDSNGAG